MNLCKENIEKKVNWDTISKNKYFFIKKMININYTKINKKIKKIINNASDYLSLDKNIIESEINKAYIYARKAHEGQFRLSWDPYIIHPIKATEFLLSLKPDIHTIQACLLHDVIEDTPKTAEDIEKVFWSDVRFLCEWMEKLWKVRYVGEDRAIWSLRKMFVAMAEDLRVVFIKLADRMHNMQTLKFHPKPEKRERIALETLNIYAPIADRLWLYHFKNFLEEECFKILEPDDYEKIIWEISEMKNSMDIFSKHAKKEIKKLLDENNIINYEIDYRIKSIYSIYKKMIKKNLDSIKWLYDLFGIRIIISNETDCYKVLWIIHKLWTPLPKRFKDYIALPKPNWYKSLHTTVIWLLKDYRKQPTEIQIKTYEMKEFSDIWVAAHFEYKEKGSKVSQDIDWVADLKELTSDLENNDFVNSLKIDVFKDRIFVFTPNWKLINLPVWSTSIDFAYYVHSDLWDRVSIVKINWEVKTLDRELKNWDVIEIIIDKNKKPNPFWLSFVKTTKAKNRIKSFIKQENKDLYRDRWKEILSKYLEKTWIFILDKDLSILKVLDSREYKIEERWSILEQIWNFSTTPASIFKKILKTQKINLDKNKNTLKKEWSPEKKEYDIIIWWEEALDYTLWKCCLWKIPRKLVAYINKNNEINIHKRNCEIIKDVNKDRLLSAYVWWNEDESLEVKITFSVLNKKWIIKYITSIIYLMDINIDEFNVVKISKYKRNILLTLEIPDYDYLVIDRLIERIKMKLKDDLISFKLNNLE